MTGGHLYAHGKILISGEYLVLKGAKALALPTLAGQSLSVSDSSDVIRWESIDQHGQVWFEAKFGLDLSLISATDSQRAGFILKLLQTAYSMSSGVILPQHFRSELEFDQDWGLGSSSSLTYLLAKFFEVDPMALFRDTQNGSGFDIACAGSETAIFYQIEQEEPGWNSCTIPEVFKDSWFVHLGNKQDSRIEVNKFRELQFSQLDLDRVSELTEAFTKVRNSNQLQDLMMEHETILSNILDRPRIKDLLFKDFQGAVKSLGAWGGDFVMAVGHDPESYFKSKGFDTVVSFRELFGLKLF